MAGELSPLTEDESVTFERIKYGKNIALVRVTFDGEETAALARVSQDEQGWLTVVPVAVLVTEAMAGKLAGPDGEPLL